MNFILSSEELTALLILSTAASFTPGPNTTLSTALAANQGLRSALRFILAVPVGWGLLLGLCMAGLGHLVLAIPLYAGSSPSAARCICCGWPIVSGAPENSATQMKTV